MSTALFRSMLKSHVRTMLSYGFGTAFYLLLLIALYPSFAHSPALNTLLKSMPEGLLKLIGYQAGIANVGDYIAGEYYSLLYIIIVAVYAITTAIRLMAHLVDTGSMAYLLATPVSRSRIAVTEVLVMLVGIAVIGAFTTMGGLVGVQWFVHDANLDVGRFIGVNVVGVLLFYVVGGYSFLFSVVARDERTAIGWAAGLTMIFYALNLLGTLSDRYAWMKHLSIFTTFDAQALMHGTEHIVWTAVSLALAAVLLFVLSAALFQRRQLSI